MLNRRGCFLLPALLCLAFITPVALAEAPVGKEAMRPAGDGAQKQPSGKTFLWKVRSKAATVYLLGSVHVAKDDLYPLNRKIEAAFAESDKLVLEIDLDAASQAAAAVKLIKAGSYRAGDSLDKHIAKETQDMLDRQMKRAGLPAGAFNRFQPWLVSVLLTMQELQKQGFSPEQGIDRHFQKRAQGKKPIVALETADDQVRMFADFPNDLQERMLKQSLDELPELDKTMDATFRAWRTGDGEALEELLLEPMQTKEYKPLFQKIFVERNEKMAEKIERLLETDSTYFVVVGAGHLIGEQGIVELLRKKKYAVEQQ